MFGMWTPGLPNGNRESAGMVSTKHEKLPNFKDRIKKLKKELENDFTDLLHIQNLQCRSRRGSTYQFFL